MLRTGARPGPAGPTTGCSSCAASAGRIQKRPPDRPGATPAMFGAAGRAVKRGGRTRNDPSTARDLAAQRVLALLLPLRHAAICASRDVTRKVEDQRVQRPQPKVAVVADATTRGAAGALLLPRTTSAGKACSTRCADGSGARFFRARLPPTLRAPCRSPCPPPLLAPPAAAASSCSRYCRS